MLSLLVVRSSNTKAKFTETKIDVSETFYY